MKSKFLLIAAKVFFAFAIIQLAWLVLAILLSFGTSPVPAQPGVIKVVEPGNWLANFIWNTGPFLLLILLSGMGFYFRWLSRRFR